MGKKPELFVIDPSIVRPEISVFNMISRLSPVPVSFHLPALVGMETISEAENSAHCLGAIILGSAASVRDEREWQGALIRWLERKMGPRFPLLGICFGHQLFAHMHGAPVVECGQKNLGFREVEILSDERMGLSARKIAMFVSHNDKVDVVPKDFEVLASSGLIPIDGLRHKTLPIWSFQAHIDATEIFALNCFYTEKKEFHRLKEGNDVLSKFLSLFGPVIPNFCEGSQS